MNQNHAACSPGVTASGHRYITRFSWLFILALLVPMGCTSNETITLGAWELEADGAAPTPIVLPAHLDLPSRPLQYTLATAVDLPPRLRGRPLTLTLPLLQAPVRLVVNGVDVPALEGDAPSPYRTKGHHSWRLSREATELEPLRVALVVDHTWTQSAWFDAPPLLSAEPGGDLSFRAVRAINQASAWASMGAFITVGCRSRTAWLIARET